MNRPSSFIASTYTKLLIFNFLIDQFILSKIIALYFIQEVYCI